MAGQFNVLRKVFHFSGILFAIIYYNDSLRTFPGEIFQENTRSFLFYVLILAYLVMVMVEFLRFRFEIVQKLFIRFVGKLLKPDEVNKMHGSMPFFLGLAVTTGFFMRDITIIGALFLMVGDPCAAWFGGRFGKHKLKNGKSIEGLAAGITGAFVAGLLYIFLNSALEPNNILSENFNTNPLMILTILLATAMGAFIAELYSSPGFFDDNFVIPVVSGLVMSFLFTLIFQLNINHVFYSLNDLLLPK